MSRPNPAWIYIHLGMAAASENGALGPEGKFCFKKIVRGQLMLHPLATTETGHWIAEHHMGKPPSTTPPSSNPNTTYGCKNLAARKISPLFFN